MQILLASAKIMNSSSLVEVPLMSEPTYKEQASKFALELSSWDTKHLMKELKCSQAIAKKIYKDTRVFGMKASRCLPSSPTLAKPTNI